MPPPPPTVVILGLGYAGALLAKSLERAVQQQKIQLIVIDRKTAIHHKIGSIRASVLGGAWAERTQIPVDYITSFCQQHIVGEVAHVQETTKQVVFKDPAIAPIKFDILVVATGTHSYSPGENLTNSEEIVQYFETLAGALARAKDVLIVGGGPSAVEFAGEIRNKYPNKPIRMVCSSKQLLSSSIAPLSKSFHRGLLRKLRELDIEVIREEKVVMPAGLPDLERNKFAERVTVQTKGLLSTEMYTDLLLWSVSSSGSVTKEGCFPVSWLNEIGELNVTSTFQCQARPDVFAIGDVCSLSETKQAVTLPSKMKLIAHNVCVVANAMQNQQDFSHQHELRGLKEYRVCLRPTMYIPIGPKHGISSYRGFTFGNMATSRWKGKHLFTEMFWNKLTGGKCEPPKLNGLILAKRTTNETTEPAAESRQWQVATT